MPIKDKSRRKVIPMVACPVCGEQMTPKGLHGHLRFKHGKTGDDLAQTYKNNVQAEERQAMVDRISKLHDQLRNVRAKRDGLKADDRSGFFTSDDAVDKLRRLYDSEEERIKADLAKLLEEAGVKDDDNGGWL